WMPSARLATSIPRLEPVQHRRRPRPPRIHARPATPLYRTQNRGAHPTPHRWLRAIARPAGFSPATATPPGGRRMLADQREEPMPFASGYSAAEAQLLITLSQFAYLDSDPLPGETVAAQETRMREDIDAALAASEFARWRVVWGPGLSGDRANMLYVAGEPGG